MGLARKLLIAFFIVFFTFSLLFTLVFGGIRLWFYHSGPLEREGAVWVSKDGKITIVTLENKSGKGKMQLEDEILEFDILDGYPEKLLGITYPGVNMFEGREIDSEVWIWDRKSSSEYEMTVDYSYTGYFTEGETITFYRADNVPAPDSD